MNEWAKLFEEIEQEANRRVIVEPEWPDRVRRPYLVDQLPEPLVYDERPLEEIRASLQRAMRDYLRIPEPDYMLLLKPPPGTGKTYAGVAFAQWAHQFTGQRVLYAGPRHAFFADIMAEADKQEQPENSWYEWQPRQDKPDDETKHTCHLAPQIAEWQQRGYESMTFCSTICGWDFINKGCPYHAQKRRHEPIIYGQHQHVVLGHPLASQFAVVIGDEDPSQAFLRTWKIPTEFIIPDGLDPSSMLFSVLNQLRLLCLGNFMLRGPMLYRELGPERVIEACQEFRIAAGAQYIQPELHTASDVDNVPFAHLAETVRILYVEALGVAAGEAINTRLHVTPQGLQLDLRGHVVDSLPKHMIWFDGTGHAPKYEALFGRRVETVSVPLPMRGQIFQVTDSSWPKTSLLTSDNSPTAGAREVLRMIERLITQRGYRRAHVGIITFMGLEDIFRNAGLRTAHFFGQRGTNAFIDVDALFVVGTPMPSLTAMEKIARQIWDTRYRAFNNAWLSVPTAYHYITPTMQGVMVNVSEFADENLNIILRSVREAEIVQAAHRARPVFRPTDVWLFTNIPLEGLAPSKLVTVQAICDAPDNVSPKVWLDFLEIVEEVAAQSPDGSVTATMLEGRVGVPERRTLHRYMDLLAKRHPDLWNVVPVLTRQRGRPYKSIVNVEAEEDDAPSTVGEGPP